MHLKHLILANTKCRLLCRLPIGSRVVGAFIMPCGGCFYCIKVRSCFFSALLLVLWLFGSSCVLATLKVSVDVQGQEDLCETFFHYSRGKGTLYDGETRLFLHKTGRMV